MGMEYTCNRCGRVVWITGSHPAKAKCQCGGRLIAPGSQ